VGTSVIDHVDDLVRYDDYPIIRQKKGLQVKSLGFYRDQEKVVGYEIVYNDAQNNTTTLRRLAPHFRTFGHKAYKEQKVLYYNEHLADIDVVHTQNEIEFIDILTTKGRHIKVFEEKLGDDERCTSFNKIDVTQKNYAPIIAFETTFSKDRLKELFVYRSPVRISKRRKQKNLTVTELNHLKAAPNLSTTLRTQQNLNLWRSLTRKEIIQKASVVRNWQNLTAQKSKIISSDATLETPSIRLDTLADQQRSREAFMEEQEYGVDDDDDEEKEDDKKDKKSPPRKRSIFGLLPFGQRKSVTNSPDKASKDKEGGFESQIKNFFFGKKGSSSTSNSQRNSRRASIGVGLYKDPEKIAKFEAAYKERENKKNEKNEKNEQMDFTLNNKARSPRDMQYRDRSDSPGSPPERREKKSKTTVHTPKVTTAHPHPPMWKKMSENVRSKLKAFAIFNEKDDKNRARANNSNHENDENLKTEQSPITYEIEADEINYKNHNRNHRIINFQSNSNSNSRSNSDSDSNSDSPSQSRSNSRSQSKSQSKSHSRTNSHSGSAKEK